MCLLFQMAGFRHFKKFYLVAQTELKPYFSNLLSYDRFVYIKKRVTPFALLFSHEFIRRNKRCLLIQFPYP